MHTRVYYSPIHNTTVYYRNSNQLAKNVISKQLWLRHGYDTGLHNVIFNIKNDLRKKYLPRDYRVHFRLSKYTVPPTDFFLSTEYTNISTQFNTFSRIIKQI